MQWILWWTPLEYSFQITRGQALLPEHLGMLVLMAPSWATFWELSFPEENPHIQGQCPPWGSLHLQVDKVRLLALKWHKSEEPSQLHSSLWDWLKSLLRLHLISTLPSAQSYFFHSPTTVILKVSPANLCRKLDIRVFPMESNLSKVSEQLTHSWWYKFSFRIFQSRVLKILSSLLNSSLIRIAFHALLYTNLWH